MEKAKRNSELVKSKTILSTATILPKELLLLSSAAALPTAITPHFLPTKPTKNRRRSQREHPPDCCASGKGDDDDDEDDDDYGSKIQKFKCNFSNFNSTNINTANKSLSAACTLLSSTSLNLSSSNKNSKLKLSATTTTTTIPATTTTSTTTTTTARTNSSSRTASPASLKISHRKTKCNSNRNENANFNLPALKIMGNVLFRGILALQQQSRGGTSLAVGAEHFGSSHTSKATASTTSSSLAKIGKKRTKFRLLPSLGATSFFTLLTLVCLETVLLSTVSNCAKSFYMHWNTSNSIFRIDNTDHIIDVNNGNLAFQFDQVHIICPVYEPGTFENETEKYIIYNVSKVEYETCRITNADPRVIAICDKPQKLLFFTISFRTYTPQPGGLEFIPGNDYYFISTSSKDDLYRRIGGRCSTNNMKVVFKVCCAPEEKNKTTTIAVNAVGGGGGGGGSGGDGSANENVNIDVNTSTNGNQQQHMNNINTIGINVVNSGFIPGGVGSNNNNNNNGLQLKPLNGQSGTSINTNIDQFNRIPIQPNNGINVIGGGGVGLGSHGGNGIMLTPGHGGINMIPSTNNGGVGVGGGMQYPGHPGQTGLRINNVPTQHYPSHKSNNNNNNNNNNDDHHHYDKHPNEVVKNEELTYNSAATTFHHQHFFFFNWRKMRSRHLFNLEHFKYVYLTMLDATLTTIGNGIKRSGEFAYNFCIGCTKYASKNNFILNCNPIVVLSLIFSVILMSSSYLLLKKRYTLKLTTMTFVNIKVNTETSSSSSCHPFSNNVETLKNTSVNLKNFR